MKFKLSLIVSILFLNQVLSQYYHTTNLKVRTFGLKPKQKPNSVTQKLILDKKLKLKQYIVNKWRIEQEKKLNEQRRVEDERRRIFKNIFMSRISGSFLNDFTNIGRF
jgi:hypothetical protein